MATNSGVSGSKRASSMASRYISHTTWAPWQGSNDSVETGYGWRFDAPDDSVRQLACLGVTSCGCCSTPTYVQAPEDEKPLCCVLLHPQVCACSRQETGLKPAYTCPCKSAREKAGGHMGNN